WPGTLQRYSYVPFLSATVRVFEEPPLINGVAFPLQELAEPPVLHRVKSCGMAPPFVTLKVTGPALTDLVESVNLNSLGLPAVTVTVVAWAAVVCAPAGRAEAQASSPRRPSVRNDLRMPKSPFLKVVAELGRQGSRNPAPRT